MTKKNLTLNQAVHELLDELIRLGVPHNNRWPEAILSTNIALRNDGLPRAGQRAPEDPGVAVYFKLADRDTVLACDKWHCVEHNVWSIAKHIAAMRGIDRWGVGSVAQAFAGYAALPDLQAAPDCWTILELPPGSSADGIRAAYRRLARTAHPDAGGSHERMAALNTARDIALGLVKILP